jgi:nucleoside phosphorylase
MQQNHLKTFLYTALPSEAKPIVDYFRLKKDTRVTPFAVYNNDFVCLTVTGIGKNAMSAGVAYTQALFSSSSNQALLNVGIAGHRSHLLGSLFLAHKIIDLESQRHFYPPIIFKPPCPTDSLQTAVRPQLSYDHAYLCDMEASAFYETAARFTSGEFIQCLKIISDNALMPVEKINTKQVSALIEQHLPTISLLIDEVKSLTELVVAPKPAILSDLKNSFRFTANEQIKLKNQLSRWAVATNNQPIEINNACLKTGKEVLVWIDQQLHKLDFYL